MASNYGDLSWQLELRVQTFSLFFLCFLTDNGTEKRKGASNARFAVAVDVGNSTSTGNIQVASQMKIFPTVSVGFKQRPVRRPLPPGEIPAGRHCCCG